MNKTELVKKVAAENDLTQKAAAAAVDSVLNSIMDSLAAREPVSLFGFGTFTCKHRDERTGRNPATGEAMTFAASNTPVLKPAKAFKEKVNEVTASCAVQPIFRERASLRRCPFSPPCAATCRCPDLFSGKSF